MAKVSRRAIARVVTGQLLAANADAQAVMRQLAAYIVEHNMVDDADVIINDIAEELYKQTGRLVVEVTSAHALSEDMRRQITEYLQQTTKARTVELHESVDENLIGGLIAKTPSGEIDLSVRSKLRQLTGLAG